MLVTISSLDQPVENDALVLIVQKLNFESGKGYVIKRIPFQCSYLEAWKENGTVKICIK